MAQKGEMEGTHAYITAQIQSFHCTLCMCVCVSMCVCALVCVCVCVCVCVRVGGSYDRQSRPGVSCP